MSVSRRLAEAAGADADTAHDPAKLVAFLRTVPAKELLAKYISSINPKVCAALQHSLQPLSAAAPERQYLKILS